MLIYLLVNRGNILQISRCKQKSLIEIICQKKIAYAKKNNVNIYSTQYDAKKELAYHLQIETLSDINHVAQVIWSVVWFDVSVKVYEQLLC